MTPYFSSRQWLSIVARAGALPTENPRDARRAIVNAELATARMKIRAMIAAKTIQDCFRANGEKATL